MNIGMSLVPEFEQLYNKYSCDEIGLKLLEIEGIAPKDLDIGLQSHNFFENKLSDVSSDSNSNWMENINPTVYRTYTSNGQMKLLGYHMLWYYSMKKYGREWADNAISMIWDGDLYFHDAHGLRIQMPYCYAFSIDKLVIEGRPYGSSPNMPPKHRKAFMSQVDKLISDLSKQFAGATAPSDFFLWYSYYCIMENIDLDTQEGVDTVIQDMQGLVCLFNEPGRAEGEPPFTNISIYDEIGLKNLFGHVVFPNFEKPDMDYIMKLQKIFCTWFSMGDPITGFPYRFPVVTINMTVDAAREFVNDNFVKDFVAKVNRKLGNFNLHSGTKSKLAMCCRYESDLDDMDLTSDSFGNGGVNIGSHRVVTPNFARYALLSCGDYDTFIGFCDNLMDISGKLLDIHRNDILASRIAKTPEYLQFFGKLGWFSLKTMFSTIGLTGVNEVAQYMGYDIESDEGTEFTLDFMTYLKGSVKDLKHKYNNVFNIEEIPGEQACVTLVKKDKLICDTNELDIDGSIVKIFNDMQMYSNQYIPLTSKTDIVTRIDLSGRFMSKISGGGILHINVESQIDSDEKEYELIKLAVKSGVNHFAICHNFGKCEDHKAVIIGQGIKKCPICGKPIIHERARVIGYYSDTHNWNPVRQVYDAPHRYYSDLSEINTDN